MEELEKELNMRLDELPGMITRWKGGEITNKELMDCIQECEILLSEYNWLQEK